MTTEKRRQETGLTVWQPFRDIEGRFEDYYSNSLLSSLRHLFPEVNRMDTGFKYD